MHQCLGHSKKIWWKVSVHTFAWFDIRNFLINSDPARVFFGSGSRHCFENYFKNVSKLQFYRVARSTFIWESCSVNLLLIYCPVNFHLRRFTQPISIWESWPLNFHLRRVTQSTSIWEELANQLSFLRVDHSIFISESWPLNFHFRELATQHPLEAACHSTVLT